ncbi:prolyl oligopeptidase family serine peptidase [Lonepinella koalarum]|uniref:prolyl oligopeptidase family serine peptidase n=1 Tax=Lonepinella koalarum TaxID=53417 RepID=UPI003F6DCA23
MKKLLMLTFAATALLSGCQAVNPPYSQQAKTTILVQGQEGGPNVPKVIIALNDEVTSLDNQHISITTAGVQRELKNAYISDAQGNPQAKSRFITLELTVPYQDHSYVASPFVYNIQKFMNEWATEYRVQTAIQSLTINGKNYSLNLDQDAINNRLVPDTALFNVRSAFSGNYRNPYNRKIEKLTLQTAAFEPENLKQGEKNPLIIWLHGQGEGGTDPDIVILGNEASALAKSPIQHYFHAGKQTGAYVLVVQTPTYWMDEGDGKNGGGANPSRYTQILMDTIKAYVKSNPDVDSRRIYLGGDSNGGYMTVNMLVNYPRYFAAAYPICEAYAYFQHKKDNQGQYVTQQGTGTEAFVTTDSRWFSTAKANKIKHIPIWFVASNDDPVVNPHKYSQPTYQALLKAGAKNVWFSYFETVQGTDTPNTRYSGHFSWIYVLNDQVGGVQNPTKILSATAPNYGFEPSNANFGGNFQAKFNGKSYSNLFTWLNDQRK